MRFPPIRHVDFEDDALCLSWADGLILRQPLSRYSQLQSATPEQRADFRIHPHGISVSWPHLGDADVSIDAFDWIWEHLCRESMGRLQALEWQLEQLPEDDILVNQFVDADTQQTLFRPLGGGIDFGEHSAQAIVREVQEELGQSINNLRLIGTLESLFVYDGKPGHEIVQVYDACFEDATVYQRAQLDAQESDGAPFVARWQGSASFTEHTPLVPQGLGELLKNAGLLD